jgi:ABC-2 type transport system permease protein
MNGIGKLTLTDIRLYLREPIGTFFTLVFPAMLVLLFGAIYGNKPMEIFGGYGSMDISMPGYTAMILATVGLLSIPITTANYRENGVLRRFKVTPLKPLTYIVSDLTANLLATILGMLGIVLLGWLLFHVRFEGQVWAVAFALIYCFLAMAAVGYLIASLAPGPRAAQVIGLAILYPMLFLSGAGMPIEILPASLQRIANFLPLYYVVKLLRGAWFGAPLSDMWLSILILGIMLVVCGGIATKLFKWD